MSQSQVDVCANPLHCLQANITTQVFSVCPTGRQAKPISTQQTLVTATLHIVIVHMLECTV